MTNLAIKEKENIIYLVPQNTNDTPKRVTNNNKKKGRKSEVYPFEVEDIKKMMHYYEEKEMWLHYMMFTLSCNLARRVGDMLSLRWDNFFDPGTGDFRQDIKEIVEDKTDKLANPRINSACRNVIKLYIEKTGCDVAENHYENPVFLQLSGTHKGKVLSDSGYLKSLKKAAKAVGIRYNVGTHSTRKTFGMLSRMLHPGDYDSMELLQTIYNHSDTKTTKHYIGLTKKKIDKYYDDFGGFFDEYIIGNGEYRTEDPMPIVSLDINDLREIIKTAYESGKNNAGSVNSVDHIDAINSIMSMVEKLRK